jgi:hypothetical protein
VAVMPPAAAIAVIIAEVIPAGIVPVPNPTTPSKHSRRVSAAFLCPRRPVHPDSVIMVSVTLP